MAFRRQDISKTTRSVASGSPRRVYPRYAKNLSLAPAVEQTIDYLDRMTGRRRSELNADAVVAAFADQKLARCIVTCLTGSYSYRSLGISEVVGPGGAARLALDGCHDAPGVRSIVHLAASERFGGVVGPAERKILLGELASGYGLRADELAALLHMDAERNALLVKTGERPRAQDVLARYNVLVTVSMLRLASEVVLTLPGMSRDAISAALAVDGVAGSVSPDGTVRLRGRRSAGGGWSQFGGRLARCATRLLLAAPGAPTGTARVHLVDEPLDFLLDGFPIQALRKPVRAVGANATAIEALVESIASNRRSMEGFSGWTVRRPLEPVVSTDGVLLPDLLLVNESMSVALVAAPEGRVPAAGFAAAVRAAAGVTPVIVLGGQFPGVPAVTEPDAALLLDHLAATTTAHAAPRTPLGIAGAELGREGWLGEERLVELFGDGSALDDGVRDLVARVAAERAPGFGLCRMDLFEELRDSLGRDGMSVGALRDAIAFRVGSGPAADALTLHVLRSAEVRPVAAEPGHTQLDLALAG